MDEDVVKIYCLVDPITHQPRYVGQTAGLLRNRLSGHISSGTSSRMRKWTTYLRSLGYRPVITLLEVVAVRESVEAEQFWISYFKFLGAALLNVGRGGEQIYVRNQWGHAQPITIPVHVPQSHIKVFEMAASLKKMEVGEWMMRLAVGVVGDLITNGNIRITASGEASFKAFDDGRFWLDCRPEAVVQEITVEPWIE